MMPLKKIKHDLRSNKYKLILWNHNIKLCYLRNVPSFTLFLKLMKISVTSHIYRKTFKPQTLES